ncbi:leukotriene A4 hydrolase [Syncephalis pseudoplumigaleata]|uniref:Leukotriene A4 hydrolase n=1 Tax=Syncephalis pseudoplumigaleata TaxID=1712513 RepID=A0A4P9YT78_9FUNG|nr:leukotriene A4 hydrolase [Syncephalis pseudoplumigaleata]|eukprot:RKP23183.1 leukotriene A4 hydrolase [Syncephalis pseudoplumigaleata]
MCRVSSVDPNSFANLDQLHTQHVHLDLAVDFQRRELAGKARVRLVAVASDVTKAVLDTRALHIDDVQLAGHSAPVEYALKDAHPIYGSALCVTLPRAYAAGETLELVVSYKTTKESGALQWLAPSQTVGKQHPYLFTQCQAIHARSLAPVQDSPAIKLTYSASIRVPKPLRALMSALATGSDPGEDGASTIYRFEQRTKMPSYLIALVVGNLEGREVGPRSTVWSEPEVVERAAWEFVDTERFIATGEALLTPYEWGRYDLLVLPGSFPYGGMENPCLTFVTPTLLAGDRSLVDVVAHEIAHSWMGNLVTTRNWEHFWLNEGWTVFIERKIIGRLRGEPARQFSAMIGLTGLRKDIELFGPTNALTALTPNLTEVDPDDAFSRVPYEKGFNLLYYLEQLVGGPSVFEPYMKAHVQAFAGQSITTAEWKQFLYDYMSRHHGEAMVKTLDTVNWHAWFKEPGMPPVTNEYDHTLANACTELSKRQAASGADKGQFSADDIKDFTPYQKVLFLQLLADSKSVSKEKLDLMDAIYEFTHVVNCEIRFAWQMLCLHAAYVPIYPHVVAFVKEQGRMKYVRPLYR